MELEDSLKCDESEGMSSIIQNVSALSMSMLQPEDESQNFIFPQTPISPNSAEPSERLKDLDIHNTIQLKIPNFPEIGIESSQEAKTDKKLKVIKVEVEFLKKSIDYLKSVLAQKSQKVSSKDEKIEKLDKVIEKQKKKLKDLKNRMSFQGCKLAQLEARIPAYFQMMDKGKGLEDRKGDQRGGLGKISIKKSKVMSTSPKGKN
jgi:hypothetical protein